MRHILNKAVKCIFITIFVLSCFSIQFIKQSKALSFSDLSSAHWAYEAIMDMVNRGIMSGYPDGTFRPNNPVQRAETAVILANVFNLEPINSKKPSFVDVSTSHWAYSHIEAINNTRLMSETIINSQFTPNKNLTRISFVPIQVRALGMKYFAENISEQEKSEAMQQFTDQYQVSYWARGYLTIAVKAGSMSGYPDRTFRPRKDVTRAEIASLIYEMLRPLRGGEGENYKVVNLSVSGAPFRAVLSKKLAGSLFDLNGNTYPNGPVQVTLNNIPFKGFNADQNGFYSIRIPIGFIGIGEIRLYANYFEIDTKKASKSFLAYSSVPFDLFPNQYGLYGFTYHPLKNELVYNSKTAAPLNLEIINRTTGDRQNKNIVANQNFSISTLLKIGENSINLVIKQPDSSWKLTYGIIFTIN